MMATPAELLAQSLAKLRTAKRFSGQSASYKKDNPAEYAKVIAYLDGSTRPTGVTTDMGMAVLLEEDARRALGVEPPPPPPPPPSSILWGARMDGEVYGRGDAPWDAITWDTFEEHAGKKVGLIEMGQPFGAHDLNAFNIIRSRSAIAVLTIGLQTQTIAQVNAGTHDALIDSWATKIGTQGHPCFMRPWWEFNGNWGYPWQTNNGVTPAEYVQAWRRFRTRADAAGASNVTWTWCPNYITNPISSVADPTPWYPGDEYVDWMGADVYAFGGETVAQVYDPIYAKLQAISPSKSIVICETAKQEVGSPKAPWITDFLTRLQTHYPKIRGFAWFNWNVLQGGTRYTWPIESSPAAEAAFAAGISSSYFRAQAPQLPLGTKVTP